MTDSEMNLIRDGVQHPLFDLGHWPRIAVPRKQGLGDRKRQN
ncbi:MAG: hypothetical protein ACI9XZ_001436 [Alphaproteobacteria bacterium]|jgi:hypothetical protein